jgi:hypothetical protein
MFIDVSSVEQTVVSSAKYLDRLLLTILTTMPHKFLRYKKMNF